MEHILFLCVIIFTLGLITGVTSLDNGLALTPPMGWMSWQRFRCITDCVNYPDECISEKLYLRMADLMVSEGYLDAGYEYIIIDDCWMEMERDETGHLVPDRERFPNGMLYVSDYVHSRGLKFGIYEDYGTKTCAGYPGIIGYMEIDAATFASWNVDYVKLDGCYSEIDDMDFGYPKFGQLLNETGRPMVYSCSWPVYQEISGVIPDYEALKMHCNLWRNWYDIDDTWHGIKDSWSSGVIEITNYFAENQDRIQPHAGPGHWNDPDMLIIGNFGLSLDQARVQMAIWAIMASPLIMSNELTTVRPEFKAILQNREIIEINQDPLGIQGLRLDSTNMIETWSRPILPSKNNNYYMSYAVAFVSHRTDGAPYTVIGDMNKLGMHNPSGYIVTDLYDISKPGVKIESDTRFRLRVNPSGVVFYKFTVINSMEDEIVEL